MSSLAAREERVTDILQRRARRPGRSPVEAVVDRVWRFFCSVRAAIYEIIFLAVLVLIGTLKGSIIPAQIPRYVPVLEPLVVRWYAFDVYQSLVFTLTLVLLAVAIVVCTINRVPGIWASIVHPTVMTTRQFFQAAEPAALFRAEASAAAAADRLVEVLKARRYRVLSEERDGTIHVYADKNRFGKLGTFPFHLGLILVLIGGIVGAQLGFREMMFTIPEGSVRDVGYGTGLRVELAGFIDVYDELGAVTEYRSDLILYDGEREVRRQSIEVNQPLTYNNVTFYQASYGQAATFRITDEAGAVLFEDGVEFTFQSRSNPDAPAAMLDLPPRGIRYELIFPNVKLDAKPEIGDIKLRPGEVYVQARDLRSNEKIGEGTVIAQGDVATLAGLGVQFVREQRFTLLQVASNPGIPILFAAAFMGVLGLVMTFGWPHRRVRALVSDTASGAEILIAPMARRDWAGKRDFVTTVVALEPQLGAADPYGGMLDERS
jgi:cytochrome c biogenesis protein